MSSKFTKALCDKVSRRWWQQEAERTAQALDQLQVGLVSFDVGK
jgi:hypothetical protein